MFDKNNFVSLQSSGGLKVEVDNPPVRKLVLVLLALVLFVIIVGLGAIQYLKRAAAERIYNVELSVPNPALQELRNQDALQLSSYDVIDKTKGVYQIPLERAMEIVSQDPERLNSIAATKK